MTSMALTMGNRARTQVGSLRLGAVVGIVFGLVVLLVFALLSSRSTPTTPHDLAARQSAVADWEAAVHPLISAGGQVVALGPRTAVADLASRKVPDAQLRTMAAGWVRRLSDLRTQIAAVPTPQQLRPAHDLLDAAMAGYVTASTDLLDAASATGPQRAQLLTDAAAAGKAADRQYDQAVAALARVRADLDLPTDWSGS